MTTGSLHVYYGGLDEPDYAPRYERNLGSTRQRPWVGVHIRSLQPRLTDDQRDYVGLRMSLIEICLEQANGNLPDGLRIMDENTGAVYQVVCGKLRYETRMVTYGQQ